MLHYLKKGKGRAGAVVGVAFGSEGTAAIRLEPPRRDEAAVLGPSTFLHGTRSDPAAALEDWIDEHKLDGARAVGVLAPGEYQIVQVEAPEVPASEMRQAATWRVRELIDYPIDQAVIDTYDPPESTQRNQNNVNVVVARRTAVAERIETLREAGLELVAIDIPELAQRNICSHLPSTKSGHALLALEHGSGLLTLFRDGEQFLSRGLDIGHGSLAHGDSGSIDTLVLEVQRSLDYFESALSQPPLGGLYVYPGGGVTASLIEALQDNLDNLDCQPVSLPDLVTVAQEPEHIGATTLHALGAGLRDQPVVV